MRTHTIEESPHHDSSSGKHPPSRLSKTSRTQSSEYIRSKNPPEPPELSSTIPKKKSRDKPIEKVFYATHIVRLRIDALISSRNQFPVPTTVTFNLLPIFSYKIFNSIRYANGRKKKQFN